MKKSLMNRARLAPASPGEPLAIYRNLPEQIAVNLRRQILSGDIAPGSLLIETELATAIGTSRGPIRDAIAILAREGLVVKIPNQRASVISLNERALREAASLRACQELFAADLAVRTISAEELERLAVLARGMTAAARDGRIHQFNELDFDFHDCLVHGSGHQLLYESWLAIHQRIRLFVTTTNWIGSSLSEVAQQHWLICKALQSRDGKGLRKGLQLHFFQVERQLAQFLAALPKTAAPGSR